MSSETKEGGISITTALVAGILAIFVLGFAFYFAFGKLKPIVNDSASSVTTNMGNIGTTLTP